MTQPSLRDDALGIWCAGVAAVASDQLVLRAVHCDGNTLDIAGHSFDLREIDRILVVGGGKAGAGMAVGLETALGADLVAAKVTGIVNVPTDCVRTLQRITIHAGRPAGVNEPTAEGVAGVDRMLHLVGTMTPRDLLIVLLSGGGSALLPAPALGISLSDKRTVTRLLMSRGAPIEDLNAVRSALSRFKGGQLAQAIPAGRAIALIISDVVADPLSVIASGPTVTVPPVNSSPADILRKYVCDVSEVPAHVWTVLDQHSLKSAAQLASRVAVTNCIIGNNATALQAAAAEALKRGYAIAGYETDQRGIAREVGVTLAERCLAEHSRPTTSRGWCWLSGGEPIVELAPYDGPRRGGRNQELALSALQRWWDEDLANMVLVSGGTDGEDGPTDAAGGIADAAVRAQAQSLNLTPRDYLAVNNAYPFLQQTGGLIQTGPTHTNVMDIRVVLSRSR
ncbi:MAG: DUF4147 domain-containing protein [Planctomycetaceae bacterium]|nr:DUF4147 domain-containing protein [Planctomycetaceae bacterium]